MSGTESMEYRAGILANAIDSARHGDFQPLAAMSRSIYADEYRLVGDEQSVILCEVANEKVRGEIRLTPYLWAVLIASVRMRHILLVPDFVHEIRGFLSDDYPYRASAMTTLVESGTVSPNESMIGLAEDDAEVKYAAVLPLLKTDTKKAVAVLLSILKMDINHTVYDAILNHLAEVAMHPEGRSLVIATALRMIADDPSDTQTNHVLSEIASSLSL